MPRTRAKPFKNWDSVPVVFNSDTCAIVLGIPVKTIRKMAKAGEIPAHKPGKNYMYEKDEIKQWMLSH